MSINFTAFDTFYGGNFSDAFYKFLSKTERRFNGWDLYPSDVRDGEITIGAGINMTGGEPTNKFAVYRALGIKVDLRTGAALTDTGTSAQQNTEQSYVTRLNAALTGIVGNICLSIDARIQLLHQIMAERAADTSLNGYADNRKAYFTFESDPVIGEQQIRQSFDEAMPAYDTKLLNKLNANAYTQSITADPAFANSKEHGVLLSLIYNGGSGLIGDNLLRAMATGNRAEAWFEIRYDSNKAGWEEINKNLAPNTKLGAGLAKRRYYEAEVFGLYSSTTEPTQQLSEAKDAYRMLQLHREKILKYEAKYGVNPDDSQGARNMIAEANSGYGLSGSNAVDTLVQSFNPAKTVLLDLLKNSADTPLKAAYTAWSSNEAGFVATNLYLDPGRFSSQQLIDSNRTAVLDARQYKDGAEVASNDILIGEGGVSGKTGDMLVGGMGNDLLVGGTGDDYLWGGKGNDAMAGGAGNDTYIIESGDGIDTIEDKMGVNQVIMNGKAVASFYRMAGGLNYVSYDGAFTAVMQDGDFIVTDVVTGDKIILNEDFQEGDFGIHFTDAPTAPVITRTIVGDLAPIDADPVEAGLQYGHDDLGNVLVDANQAESGRADVLYDSAGNDDIRGLGGNDRIEASRGGDDRIDGGEGDDALMGRAGNDIVIGGTGMDTLRGDDGRDELYAGNQATLEAAFSAQEGAASGLKGDFIDGSEGDDLLVGDAGNDALNGGADADIILGGAGDDTIRGDFKTSNVQANWTITRSITTDANGVKLYTSTYNGVEFSAPTAGGDDTIYAGGGVDWVEGEFGDDYIDGGSGDDVLLGNEGSDFVLGGTGNDVMDGDSAYTAVAQQGDDYLDGGAGNDELTGGGRNDQLFGGTGDDLLTGDGPVNILGGAAHGSDYLDGEDGNDQLVGGGKDDILYGGAGDDLLMGDDDQLAAEFHGADYLDGEDGNDTLLGGGGDDVLIGGNGDDYLNGGGGADYMEGGTGINTYVVDNADDVIVQDSAGTGTVLTQVSYTLSDGLANITLTGDAALDAGGNASDNVIRDNAGINTLTGGTGSDVYFVTNVEDSVVELEGEGFDAVSTSVSFALGEHIEQLSASGMADVTLTGNNQDNTLLGNAGNNVLTGGAGNDYLVGNAGNDVYVFNRGDGQDTIQNTDFLSDVAQIELPQAVDILRFGTGISDTDVIGYRSGNDVVFKVKGTTDQVRISAYYNADVVDGTTVSDHKIDQVEFGNGAIWDQADIQALVDLASNNHAPVVNGSLPGLQARAGLAFSYVVPAGTYTDPDAGDTVLYSVRMQDGSPLPSWLQFDAASRTLSGIPDVASIGALDFVLWGTDDYGVATGVLVNLSVAENQAPVLAAPLADQNTIRGGEFSYTLPEGAFADPDAGDALTYSATLADGSALPSWLVFDPLTRSFSGIPSTLGTISVRVQASDWSYSQASDVFDITVQLPTYIGTAGNDTLNGGVDDDILRGLEGNDTLNGNGGNDELDGGGGNDILYGQTGDDLLYGGAGTDTLYGDAGNDTLVGESNADTLYGGAGDDTLIGGGMVYGGDGNDTFSNGVWMEGGLGLDTYRVFETNGPRDAYITPGTDGGDVVIVGGGFNPADIKVALRSTSSSVDLKLINLLDGRTVTLAGVITPAGSTPRIAELRFENAPGAVWTLADLKRMSLVGDDVNNTIFGYTDTPSVLVGAGGKDLLQGGNVDDTLDGGSGDDYLAGMAGADTYVFGLDSGADEVVDIADAGNNIVQLKEGITPADVTLLRTGQGGGWGMDGIGTMSANDSLVLLVPSTGARLWITQFFKPNNASAVSEIRFADGSGTVWTYADIVARAGASLSGAQNAQTGTTANDVYTVDNAGDTITEAAGGGTDTVVSSVSYVLPDQVENLNLVGQLALNGKGNSGNNVLRGNSGDNLLRGAGGIDQYYGGQGNDTYIDSAAQSSDLTILMNPLPPSIYEGVDEGYDTLITDAWSVTLSANVERLLVPSAMNIPSYSYTPGVVYQHQYIGNSLDNVIDLTGATQFVRDVRIDGGAGNDIMIGSSTRFDTYVVDSAGDVVIEKTVGGGQVETSVTYTLSQNLLNIKLTGSVAIDGTGNELNNTLDGRSNSAVNVLAGLAGDDIYYLGAGDTIVESAGGGNDTVMVTAAMGVSQGTVDLGVWSNVESAILADEVGSVNVIGDAGNNRLTGNLSGNTIDGLDGDDVIVNSATAGSTATDYLNGGNGNDSITSLSGYSYIDGGDGNDTIVLNGVRYSNVNGGSGDDLIVDPTGLFSVQLGVGGGNDLVSITNVQIRSTGDWASLRDTRSSISLAVGTDASTLRFNQIGDSLIVSLSGSGDSVTITKFFESASSTAIQSVIDSVRLPDGTVLTRDAIAAGLGRSELQIATAGHDLLIASAMGQSLTGDAGDDQMVGQSADDQLDGGDGNDRLYGGDGIDLLTGGAGNDALVGGHGADNYAFGLGWGQDVVDDMQGIERPGGSYSVPWIVDDGAADTIVFDSSIATADISVSVDALNLRLTHRTTGDSITVLNYFDAPNALTGQVELIRFSDGTVWDRTAVDQLVRTVTGTSGDDVLVGLANIGSDVYGLAGNDTLSGQSLNDNLYGGDGNDILSDVAGSNLLDGGAGADQMNGGTGNDIFVVDDAGDVVAEDAGDGTDTVLASLTYTLGSNVENLTLTGAGANNGTGNALANVLTGNAANNTLNGGSGADTLMGGAGDDIYVVDSTADAVTESTSEGLDLVQSSVTYTLSSNVENLTLTGTSAINGTGNALDNVLTGNSAANVLTGGAGNDTYIVGTGDTTTEASGGGTDTVQSSVTWTLASNVENLVLTGTSAINGTGNSAANVLTGNSAANVLTGGAGNDTYIVGTGDTTTEASGGGTDTVQSGVTWTLANNVENLILTGTSAINGTGNTLANVITGNGADNALSGGTGADTLIGGAGNDTYTVDNVGDVVTELTGEGVDLVNSSVTYSLAANVENLTLTGTSTVNGTGNALDNVLTGNSKSNVLTGGAGNDTYVVGTGDTTTEAAGGGIDTVQSSITWTLAANVENLTLTGSTAINGTGNALDNVLTGNSAANVLTGGAGNDTYIVGTGDSTTEAAGAGTDTVQSTIAWTLATNVENLTLTGTAAVNGTGNTADNVMLGNASANTLTGNGGNDTLDGKAGSDILIGGAGNDIYWLGRGHEADSIQENDVTAGNIDVAQFDSGIAIDQLWFRQVSNNLEVSVIGTSDAFTVKDWYLGSQYHVEQFKTNDGKTLLDSQVQSLVQAMAAFTPPAAGQTTLPESYASTLTPVIAANWQ